MMKIVRTLGLICIAYFTSMIAISCNKDEMQKNDVMGKIDFYCKEISSKAAQHATIEDLKAGFKLYAHTTFDPNSATPTTSSSFVRDVYYDGTGWTYEGTQYWIPQATFNFRGYFPSDAFTVNDNGYSNYELLYDNITNKADQKDVLFASTNKSSAEAKEEGYAPVPLMFEHILTKINIKVKVDTDDPEHKIPKLGVRVKGVGLSNVANNGRFANGIWTDSYGTAEIGHNFTVPRLIGESQLVEVSSGNYNTILETPNGELLFEENDEFLLMPQQLQNNEAALKLYVDITTPPTLIDGEYKYEVLMQDQPMICNIPAITWEKSKKYTYIVTVTKSFSIEIDTPEVEAWEDSQMSGTIIIR